MKKFLKKYKYTTILSGICLSLTILYYIFPSINIIVPTITGHISIPFSVYFFDTSSKLIQNIVGTLTLLILTFIYGLIGYLFDRRNKKK